MSDVEISFLCVQPIQISSNIYSKLLVNKISFEKIERYVKSSKKKKMHLEWLENYNTLYDSFHSLKELQLNTIDISKLYNDLQQTDFFVYNMHQETLELSSFLNKEKTKFALYYDLRFSYFLLVYEVHFVFPKDILETFLDYSNDEDNLLKKDLYNTIRNLIVKESYSSTIGVWGASIQKTSIEKAKMLIKDIYNIKTAKDDITITPSSCNISCFILDAEANNQKLLSKLEILNNFAERIPTDTKIESFYNDSVYFGFYGRFHTIYLKKRQDEFRYQPLQFHIQYMWFLLERYNHFMNEINLQLMQNDSIKNLQKYTQVIHFMINKIELLHLHDNNFKHSIEIDYQTIYKNNEERWSLPSLLLSAQRYVNFFKDYLDRIFRQKNDLSQKKQNNILLSISILQLVALISVWNDYLSLLNEENMNKSGKILQYFESTKELVTFNFFTPVYIFGVIILILVYLSIRKK